MCAVRYGIGKGEGVNVAVRNPINNFAELDTMLVLLASVAISSFMESDFGVAPIVAGMLGIWLVW